MDPNTLCANDDGFLAIGLFEIWPTKSTGMTGVPLCEECRDWNKQVSYKIREVK